MASFNGSSGNRNGMSGGVEVIIIVFKRRIEMSSDFVYLILKQNFISCNSLKTIENNFVNLINIVYCVIPARYQSRLLPFTLPIEFIVKKYQVNLNFTQIID